MAETHIQDGGLILGARGTTVTVDYAFVGDYEIIRYYKGGLPYEDASHKMITKGSFPGFFADTGSYNYQKTQLISYNRGQESSTDLDSGITTVRSWAYDTCYGDISVDIPIDFPQGGQIYLFYWDTANDYWAGNGKVARIRIPREFTPWQHNVSPGTVNINDGIEGLGKLADFQDKTWQFIDGEWQWTTDPDVRGGGRYRNNIVVFSFDANGLGNLLYS
jgi:hypothetical protein